MHSFIEQKFATGRPAGAVLDMDVVGAGPVDAVALVAADSGLAQPRARAEVAPVAVHCRPK
jgi:hypothetical protein